MLFLVLGFEAEYHPRRNHAEMELFLSARRILSIGNDNSTARLAALLYRLRKERGISQLQLADAAGVDSSVVNRAEAGRDARASTWEKLFYGLGYRLRIEEMELAEEIGDLLSEEAGRRFERRRDGLCAGKRRFFY